MLLIMFVCVLRYEVVSRDISITSWGAFWAPRGGSTTPTSCTVFSALNKNLHIAAYCLQTLPKCVVIYCHTVKTMTLSLSLSLSLSNTLSNSLTLTCLTFSLTLRLALFLSITLSLFLSHSFTLTLVSKSETCSNIELLSTYCCGFSLSILSFNRSNF